MEYQDATKISFPKMRSRYYRNPVDQSEEMTWRLGDIVHSSPTLVGRPVEGYHLLYREYDQGYGDFQLYNQRRRNVIYVGGNDGMIHAFNGGFFDPKTKTFKTSVEEPTFDHDDDGLYEPADGDCCDWNGSGSFDKTTDYPLGAELWAYVPYNLLPHLYWLTEKDYPHVYYNDLKPRIFDAKIFPEDSDHPKGWGTVMVVGMRLGGGKITADLDGDGTADGGEPTMRSAYVIFDITNPEKEPKVLAEIAMPDMGYTTCYPAAMPMNKGLEWYLVFGSGPADDDGDPAPHMTSPVDGSIILSQVISKQKGKLFVANLSQLVKNGKLGYVDTDGVSHLVDGQLDMGGNYYIEELDDDNSWLSDPTAIDYDWDFNTNVVYYGTVIGDEISGWGGKLQRCLPLDDATTSNWVTNFFGVDRADNTLINLTDVSFKDADGDPLIRGGNYIGNNGQPITSAPIVSYGEKLRAPEIKDYDDTDPVNRISRDRWIFFGTGRYLTTADGVNDDQQSYYGIKEPYDVNDEIWTWGTVNRDETDLLNTGYADVYDDKDIVGVNNVTGWSSLVTAISSYDGWYNDFQRPKERNVGRGVLLGELLTFTTFAPSIKSCGNAGDSWLHARYYSCGTAFYKSTIGWTHDDKKVTKDGVTDNGIVEYGEKKMDKEISLGGGLMSSPSIHIGSEEGSKAFVQSSEAKPIPIDQLNPGTVKSGKGAWYERKD